MQLNSFHKRIKFNAKYLTHKNSGNPAVFIVVKIHSIILKLCKMSLLEQVRCARLTYRLIHDYRNRVGQI